MSITETRVQSPAGRITLSHTGETRTDTGPDSEESQVTERFLPYGRQTVTEGDIAEVSRVLTSDWLTQGPTIQQFEAELARTTGAEYAVACANGTAALHLAMLALSIGPGDKVLTSPITFMADANCARYVGADVVFADIDPATACISPDAVEEALKQDTARKIKAVVPVSFGGQPADLPAIHQLAGEHGAAVVSDACHAIGGSYEHEGTVHTLGGSAHADMTVFSFHPVKHVAMGEGGAITTDDEKTADRLRCLRSHGIARDHFVNSSMARTNSGASNPWYHELQELGYNYRLSDIHAALGLSQLRRLPDSVRRRNELASLYRELIERTFAPGMVTPLAMWPDVVNAYHLFVVRIDFERLGVERADVMNRLKAAGIGTQVHYIPIHLQPYYRVRYGLGPGDFPAAEAYYAEALSLPMFPDLRDSEIEKVITELQNALRK